MKHHVEDRGTFGRAMRRWTTMLGRRKRYARFQDGRMQHVWPSAHRTRGGIGFNRLSRLIRRTGGFGRKIR